MTYVWHDGEPEIHFLAEWLSSWFAVQFGPRTFGLPYRHGRIRYEYAGQGGGALRGARFAGGNYLCVSSRAETECSVRAVRTRFAERMADGTLHGVQLRGRCAEIFPHLASAVAAVPDGRGTARRFIADGKLAVVGGGKISGREFLAGVARCVDGQAARVGHTMNQV
ncbi:MAG: hypothetical protein RLZZ350_628 [Verrucomicrobiota bacterium]